MSSRNVIKLFFTLFRGLYNRIIYARAQTHNIDSNNNVIIVNQLSTQLIDTLLSGGEEEGVNFVCVKLKFIIAYAKYIFKKVTSRGCCGCQSEYY